MVPNDSEGLRKFKWTHFLWLGEAQEEQVPVPNQPLPDAKTQIENLEALASELAKTEHDVSEASRILDALRKKISSDSADSCNERLNQARSLLYSAPGRRRFSKTIWPYLLMAFEFLVLMFWGWLILDHQLTFNQALLRTHLSLLSSIFVGFITGSIGACTFAIFGLYSHLIYRNVYPGFVAWYIARPAVGGVLGAFVGIIGSIILGGVGATGDGANTFTLGVSFLAGANEKFAAQMIERFTSKVLGVSSQHKDSTGTKSDK